MIVFYLINFIRFIGYDERKTIVVTTFTKYFFEGLVTKPLFLSSKRYMSADDDQLYIEKILNGDTKAFAVLVNRYKYMVYSLAIKMLKNREEAEEVSQDTFVKIFKSLDKFKGDSKFSTWVYRITYNSCLDRIKTYRRNYDTITIDEFTENQIRSLETAFDIMERSDREKSVLDCLQRLPVDDKVLLTLFYYEELSLEEISKIVDLDQNNVKVKLFRARKKMATILRRRMEPTMLENYEQRSR